MVLHDNMCFPVSLTRPKNDIRPHFCFHTTFTLSKHFPFKKGMWSSSSSTAGLSKHKALIQPVFERVLLGGRLWACSCPGGQPTLKQPGEEGVSEG